MATESVPLSEAAALFARCGASRKSDEVGEAFRELYRSCNSVKEPTETELQEDLIQDCARHLAQLAVNKKTLRWQISSCVQKLSAQSLRWQQSFQLEALKAGGILGWDRLFEEKDAAPNGLGDQNQAEETRPAAEGAAAEAIQESAAPENEPLSGDAAPENEPLSGDSATCKACDGRGRTGVIPGWTGFGLRSGSCRQCGGTGHVQHGVNRTSLQHLARAGAATVAAGAAVVGAAYFGVKASRLIEELKDGSLEATGKFAAFSGAAYGSNNAEAMELLHSSGVLNSNWCVDEALSNDHHKVFFNPFTKEAVVALRGTSNWGDIGVDALTIVPGLENQSSRFAAAMEVTKRAMDKYGESNTIATGHSLGGNMADFVGRNLGIPSVQFNPGIGARAFQTLPSATSSTSHCTWWDPISKLHQQLPGDARVEMHMPKPGTSPHKCENFYQQRGGTDSVHLSDAVKVVKIAACAAFVSANVTGHSINAIVDESRMESNELNGHINKATSVGTVMGGLAGLGTLGIASIPVATAATSTAAVGVAATETVAVATTTLAGAAGFSASAVAAVVTIPVAAVSAGTYVAKQFGKVPLTKVLEEWCATRPDKDWAGSLMVCGTVRNDCNFVTEIRNGSKWKGITVFSGALAFRGGDSDFANNALLTPYSRICAVEWDREYLGELGVDGYTFRIFKARDP